jgi:pimeloyl-ACP methyl ester carboxylesterase
MKTTNSFQKVGAKVSTIGIEIYYEAFGKPENPAVLLIMGLDAQCVVWSMNFIQPLVDAGYYVIRFDNRDIGLSTWMEDWHRSRPYTLEDMARDTAGLLDALNIKKAHIVGASMGGMIAQRFVLSYKERALSLTSIMSSGYVINPKAENRVLMKVGLHLLPFLAKNITLRHKLLDGKVTVEDYVKNYRNLAGKKYPYDEDYFRRLFTWSILERKGQNPKARLQQFSAIVASGSRLHELPHIQVPTLVLHGTDDKLIPPIHAKIYAPLIPHAKMLWLEGVGHELPIPILPLVHTEMLANFNVERNAVPL